MSPRLLIGHEEDSKWAREEVPISTNQKFMVVTVVGGSTTHFSDKLLPRPISQADQKLSGSHPIILRHLYFIYNTMSLEKVYFPQISNDILN